MSLDFLPASAYDHNASVLWASKVDARPKHCFWNALLPVLTTQGAVGVYVEGFALAPYGMVLDHGWIETPDGRVIDPTFPACEGNNAAEPYRYMPVLRFRYEQVKDIDLDRFPRFCDGGTNFRLEQEGPWASTRLAAYVARNRLEAANADGGD